MTSGALSPGALLTVLMLLLPGILSARASTGRTAAPLVVGAVQFAVSEETYRSMESFRRAVENSLNHLEAEAAVTGTGCPLNLAVFPEYTSAFCGLSFLHPGEIRALAADPAAEAVLINRALKKAEPEIISMWSEIARERGYAILAGTALVLSPEDRIRNRAMLFSPEGNLIWTQDKVFPGAPEIDILKLETGEISDARPFEINGRRIVTTICRDTYHGEWETYLPEADLWIDIKANELPFSRAYYDEALSRRLPESPTDAGLTVSLSGNILGFSFSGPTEFLKDNGNETEIITSTDPYRKNTVLLVTIR